MFRFSFVLLISLFVTHAFEAMAQVAVVDEPTVEVSAVFEIPDTDEGLPGAGPIRRYDWFRDLWRERRSKWATEKSQDQMALVFLGDSITQGWGPRISDAFDAKVANRGISGDTTRGVLIRLQEDVLDLNPSGVVILIGTNDLEEGASPPTIAGNLKLILAELERHRADMPIILCSVFPSSAAKQRPAADIQEINKLYGDVVKTHDQVTMLDTYTLFANADGDAKESEFPDLLHPNQIGYEKWAKALRPVLETMNLCEASTDDFAIEPGYQLLFNGEDLTGWMYRPSSEGEKKQAANWRKSNPAAPPWPIRTTPELLDGKTAASDGRYIANHSRLIVTIPKEGRRIQQLWTQQEFPDDFELKLEFRASPNADSGIFIRGKQLQCRDYLLAGPYKELKQYRPLDWNDVTITVRGQTAHCTCNGEVLDAAFAVPKSGPIGLEGDRGQMEYRRIRWRALED